MPVKGQTVIEGQIRETINSLDELKNSEREALIRKITETLPFFVLNRQLDREQLKGLAGLISSGLFEEVEIEPIGHAAGIAVQAMLKGADAESITEIAPIGFTRDITVEQMTAAAESYKSMKNAGVSEEIYRQVVSYAMYNNWRGGDLTGCARGLAAAKRQNLPADKLALALIIRVDQGLGGVSIEQAVGEETDYVRGLVPSDAERQRRETIYQAMQAAKEAGLSDFTATDFYYNAVEEQWQGEDAEKLFQALAEGYKKGMTAEKLALAYIIRMEMDAGKVPVERIIREETAYVESMEKKLVERKISAPQTVEPGYGMTNGRIDPSSMRASIESFMGTPYIWGGETRRGTDCSGFTRTVYFEQGILIPRVSYQQFQIGTAVEGNAMEFGDLVFFNKNGWRVVSHVGIYVGEGKFAHSCCSKGVTVSSFNKRYYRNRYAGAKRIG